MVPLISQISDANMDAMGTFPMREIQRTLNSKVFR